MALSAPFPRQPAGFDAVAREVVLGIKASTKCYQGGIAVVDSSGYCLPGKTALGLIVVGIFDQPGPAGIDNTSGSSGALLATVRRGTFKFANSGGGDAIAQANIGQPCYIVDDTTVALTDGAGTRSFAGIIQGSPNGGGVDSDGVWVEIGSTGAAFLKVSPFNHQAVAATTVLGELVVARGTWANPGAGAQDVQLFAAAGMPIKARVIDAQVRISNAGAAGANTGTLRDTAGGAGTALSSAMATGVTGRSNDALSATAVASTANGLFLRLTDGTGTGEVIVLLRPET